MKDEPFQEKEMFKYPTNNYSLKCSPRLEPAGKKCRKKNQEDINFLPFLGFLTQFILKKLQL